MVNEESYFRIRVAKAIRKKRKDNNAKIFLKF